MQITVIIPVFNATAYVEQAVASALNQPETGEVLLVEDGSTDSSLAVCQRLAKRHDSVRLFQHPGGWNCGAGASRNLGLREARFPWIAFLDADDYYLPGRFQKDAEVLARHPDADGMYDATGMHFEDKTLLETVYRHPKKRMYTLRLRLAPEELFAALVVGGGKGSFCTDGIVLKRELLERTGFFDPTLRMSQDTHLWIRAAALGRLYPGEIETPVSMARVHRGNRVTPVLTPERRTFQYRAWRSLVVWGHRAGLDSGKRRMLAEKCMEKLLVRATDIGVWALAACWIGDMARLAQVHPHSLIEKPLWSHLYHSMARCAAHAIRHRHTRRGAP